MSMPGLGWVSLGFREASIARDPQEPEALVGKASVAQTIQHPRLPMSEMTMCLPPSGREEALPGWLCPLPGPKPNSAQTPLAVVFRKGQEK